jgi:hypothetical protein
MVPFLLIHRLVVQIKIFSQKRVNKIKCDSLSPIVVDIRKQAGNMRKKFSARYIYEGLGFPVELHHVEMVKIGKEWAPKIDVRKVAKDVMKELPFQASRLTGAQIRFIR